MILPQNEAFGHGLERIEFFHQDPFCREGQPVSSHNPNGVSVLSGGDSNGCAFSARTGVGDARSWR